MLLVNEAYTSKTVNWTGKVNHNLGGRKLVRGSDGHEMDRDINGARGIFLRALAGVSASGRSACRLGTCLNGRYIFANKR